MNPNNGLLITFEGGEGSGKTTLVQNLFQYLQTSGRKTFLTKEPGGSPLGVHIRNLLLDKTSYAISDKAELLLFLADRANHLEEIIFPALHEGSIVLCDRFSDSTLAYQGALGSIDENKLKSLVAFAQDGITPDLTLYLDIPPEEGLKRAKRISNDRMEKKALDFHKKVRTNFLHLASANPSRFFVIDATLSIEEVFAIALDKVKEVLHARV